MVLFQSFGRRNSPVIDRHTGGSFPIRMYQKGKTFDEIQVGDEASFAKTITETDIYLFAFVRM